MKLTNTEKINIMNTETKKLLSSLEVSFSEKNFSFEFIKCQCKCCDTFLAIFEMKDREFTIEVDTLYDYFKAIELFHMITGDPLICVTNQVNGVSKKKNDKIVDKFFNMLDDE